MASDDPTAANRYAFLAQPTRLLLPTVRDQFAAGPDHAPPGETGTPREKVANRAGRSRIAGSARDLPVADDLPTREIA